MKVNVAFNNIMFKRFLLTDTEYYQFDIKFIGTVPRTFTLNNIINDVVVFNNRITNIYSRSITIPKGSKSFKVSFPYELENNNYIIIFNTLYDSGKVLLTSKGTKDIWFYVENIPGKDEMFCFKLEYKLNS